MKKVIVIILAVALCIALVGCSSSDTSSSGGNSSQAPSQTPSFSDDNGKITLGAAELCVGLEIDEAIIEKIGEPEDILSAPSCYFDGEDTIYLYEGFSLYTYRDGDKDVLYIIELSDGAYSTNLGAKVGMNIYDVEELYGGNSSGTATSKVFKLSENSKIRFTFDDTDTVILIEYELIG